MFGGVSLVLYFLEFNKVHDTNDRCPYKMTPYTAVSMKDNERVSIVYECVQVLNHESRLFMNIVRDTISSGEGSDRTHLESTPLPVRTSLNTIITSYLCMCVCAYM